jgi:hypothetical protein
MNLVPGPERFLSRRLSRGLVVLLGVGIAAIVITLLIGFQAPEGSETRKQCAFSWLFAYIYWFTILIGCFFWILVHHATDSSWGVLVRRQMENLAGLLPWMVVFFIPLLFLRNEIWNWMTVISHPDANLAKKIDYFQLHIGSVVLPFFWLRAVFYLLFFGIAATYFKRTSIRQDSDGDPRWTVRMRGASFVCLILFAAAITFMAFDWIASLDYKWASTMWGVYIFAGSAGAAMALIILVVLGLKSGGYLAAVNVEHYHIMGKLLLTFSIFWGYIGFSQYMLTWYGNIPEETSWFIRRNVESWNIASYAMVIGRFFIPFLYLLFERTKRTPRLLVFICFWILVMHIIDTFISIIPFVHPRGVQMSLLDVLSLLAIGCPLAFLYLRTLGNVNLAPTKDPRLLESVQLSN